MADVLLSADAVSRSFGGLVAVDQVSLTLVRGEIHAVIGPNGAGKSTLINLLAGDLAPSAGAVHVGTTNVTGWTAHRIARAGVARTFQHSSLFAEFSAFEHCRLAVQAHATGLPPLWRDAYRRDDWNRAAKAALDAAGLVHRAGIHASALAHGERRALEVAMALASSASVLLLDEPLAGMGTEDAAVVVALLRALRPRHAILLVEHDMDAVFALADRLTVMSNGRVLATGDPGAIRANAEVQRAYLGSDADALP